mgnify:CR=1 FL=1
MRELNVNEVKEVNGGFISWIANVIAGNAITWGAGHAWENRQEIGEWSYNSGRSRRSML